MYVLRWGTFGEKKESGGGNVRIERGHRRVVTLKTAVELMDRRVMDEANEWVALFLDKRKGRGDA